MLSFNATVAVCKAIVEGAAAEIRGRCLQNYEAQEYGGPEEGGWYDTTTPARGDVHYCAIRGAALKAIDNVYYDLMTPKARDKMRDKGGREALLELAGWDDCP